MFSLIYGFWTYMFRKSEYFIVVLGLDRAGKTTMLERFKSLYQNIAPLPPEKIGPTVGLNLANFDVGRTRLVCWDLGGQLELRTMWDKYYDGAHALIYVMDSTDSARLEEACVTFESLLREKKLDNCVTLILLNKCDVQGGVSANDVTQRLNLQQHMNRPYRLQSVSGLTGEGVDEGMQWLVEELRLHARAIVTDQGFD